MSANRRHLEVLQDFVKKSILDEKLFLHTSRFGRTELDLGEELFPIEKYPTGLIFWVTLAPDLSKFESLSPGYRPEAPFEIPFTGEEINSLIIRRVLEEL
jgi:hypothetical protein